MKKTFIFLCVFMALQTTASFATANEPVKEDAASIIATPGETAIKWEFYSAHEDPSPEFIIFMICSKTLMWSKKRSFQEILQDVR